MGTKLPPGSLSFTAKPLPHHERLLERIEYYVEHGFPTSDRTDLSNTVRSGNECARVRELMFRVCGVELPRSNNDTPAKDLMNALEQLHRRVEFDLSRHMIEGAMHWLRHHYGIEPHRPLPF